ncbi:calcium:proton antiporter [Acidovorax cavernicola]|uniref:Calcium:proton antiporter n=1 Tax=Acidovorax cavernicola TaxID=1675792 RepID=A0A9X8GVV0_9BURK|nr:calcium:proton antiporter [Acidovorax cavernicola]RIX81983.1 calcium:proton antiporter [Acidovorax cavernicola]
MTTSPTSPPSRLVPPATWALIAAAWLVVGLFVAFGDRWLAAPISPVVAVCVFLALFVTILAASFGVVREADHLAHQLGEPYGTLILTLSIVSIEVILIASVLLGPGEFPTIGRDSIFAVMMIILNLVIGICLIAGSARHGDQEYNAQGTTAYLSMIVLLTGTALVLPNHTSGAGEFTPVQAIGMSVLTAVLYGAFLWMQMRSHQRFFIQPETGRLSVRATMPSPTPSPATQTDHGGLDKRAVVVRSLLLLAMILPIVLLAHYLAVVADYGIAAAGAPAAVGGVLIAIIVFTPESITAVRAAMNNEMQRAVNLCLGAFVSTVGLTVPAVLVIGLVTGKQVVMGISGAETLLFAVTAVLTMLSFNGQRTSPIQGLMHLLLFAVYGMLLFLP